MEQATSAELCPVEKGTILVVGNKGKSWKKVVSVWRKVLLRFVLHCPALILTDKKFN